MNSKVIKFVAGGGKTTQAEKILKENRNGLYLAFTNPVVDTLARKGYISKTIDSLFFSFIMPKFYSMIPLISNGSNTKYIDSSYPNYLRICRLKIKLDGSIYNQTKNTGFDLHMTNDQLYSMSYGKNLSLVKTIFSKNTLRLTESLAEDIYLFILVTYEKLVVDLLKKRFDYIIIDEAQDLKKGFREEFAKIIFKSDIKLYIFGDDNQNINSGGEWFESLSPDEIVKNSFRCPESNCKWIRKNIGIDINGNCKDGNVNMINISKIKGLDDGKRVLLYCLKTGKAKTVLNCWKGPCETIKKAKGRTIDEDVVIVSGEINYRNLYTGITRTTKNCFLCIDNIKND